MLPSEGHQAQASLDGVVAAADQESAAPAGPVLAAPKPRLAVPTEDPEDDELIEAAEAEAANQQSVEAEPEAEPEAQAEEEPVDLFEEEQEAERRARLARRMAAIGGQRIGALPGMAPPPITGAPKPSRKKSIAAEDEQAQPEEKAEAEEEVERAASPRRTIPRGAMAIPGLTAAPGMSAAEAEGEALERTKSPEAPVRLASPPPLPTSPPPKPATPAPATSASPPPVPKPMSPPPATPASPPPLPPGRPSSTAPLGEAAAILRGATPDNVSRRSSVVRPAVPQGIRSREPSTVEDAQAEAKAEAEAEADAEPQPPRPPSTRPPPLPAQAPPPAEAPAPTAVPAPASVPVSASGFSSRDLDLMPSSRKSPLSRPHPFSHSRAPSPSFCRLVAPRTVPLASPANRSRTTGRRAIRQHVPGQPWRGHSRAV